MSDFFWECSPEALEQPLEKLRVGDTFTLVCTGEALSDRLSLKTQIEKERAKPLPEKNENEKQELKEPQSHTQNNQENSPQAPSPTELLKDKYRLKVLEVKLADYSRVDLKVASYVAGKHKVDKYILKDGTQKIPIKPFELNINSVLSKDPQNPPQVIGPKGPLSLGYPLWLVILLTLISLIFMTIVFRIWKKSRDVKRLLKELFKNKSHLTPIQEFSKELRALLRESKILEKARKEPFTPENYLAGLVRSYNMYFSRNFKIPAHIWSSKETLKAFRKKHKKIAYNHYEDLSRYYTELEKAKQNVNQLNFEDCQQLSEMGLQIVSKVHLTQKGLL